MKKIVMVGFVILSNQVFAMEVENYEKINKKLSQLTALILKKDENTNERFIALEKKTENNEQRITSLENAQKQITNALDVLQSNQQKLETGFKNLEKNDATLQKNLVALENKIPFVGSFIGGSGGGRL